MKQSKLMSFLESTVNIIVGLGVAMISNAIILPLVGFDVTLKDNVIIAAFMTIVSLVRSYGLRRLFEALHIRRPLSPFMQAVVAERYRQIEQEGWSLEHDDGHARGEIALAGMGYVDHAAHSNPDYPETGGGYIRYANPIPPRDWPWSADWWKPEGFRRDLVKGCALILAEGEKFDRARRVKSYQLIRGGYSAPGDYDTPRPPSPTTGSGVTLTHNKSTSEHAGPSA